MYKIKSMKIKKSANEQHLVFVIRTTDRQVFEFEIHQGLAWRMRHRIHKLLGFDESELNFGRRYAQWHQGDR
jgi:hypothetical protein